MWSHSNEIMSMPLQYCLFNCSATDQGGVTRSLTTSMWEKKFPSRERNRGQGRQGEDFWDTALSGPFCLPTKRLTPASLRFLNSVGKAMMYCLLHGGEFPCRLDPLIFKEQFEMAFDLNEIHNWSGYVGKVSALAVQLFGGLRFVELSELPAIRQYLMDSDQRV